MSTKTTIKRIALVAVSALGFGVLSTVAPANAAITGIASITTGTVGPVRTGAATIIPVTINYAGTAATTDTFTVYAQVTAAPTSGGLANAASKFLSAGSGLGNKAGSSFLTWSDSAGTVLATEADASLGAGLGSADTYSANVSVGQVASGATSISTASGTTAVNAGAAVSYRVAATTQTSKTIYLKVTPDLAGSYTFLIGATQGLNTAFKTGDVSNTVTISTGTVATSVTMSALTGTYPSGTYGALVKATLKDASGVAATLTGLETLNLTSSKTTTTFTNTGGTTITALGAGDFAGGVAYFYVKDTTAAGAALVITATGAGALSASVSSTVAVTSTKNVSYDDTAVENASSFVFPTTASAGVGAKAAGTYTAASTSGTYYVNPSATSQTFEVGLSAAAIADGSSYVQIVDTSKKILGTASALTYELTYSWAKGDTYATFSVPAQLLNGESYNIVFPAASTTLNGGYDGTNGASKTWTIQGQTVAAGTLSASPSLVTAATAGSVTIKTKLTNQFGQALANTVVTASVVGRNATLTSASLITDAYGYVSYTVTDAGTTGTSDVVSFASTGATTVTSTITWGAVAVSTVTVTGGATADTVAYPAAGATTKAISTAKGGAAGATTTFTATVKDASGNVLAGVPVTWTVDKATAGITKTASVDSSICYTTAAGTCTTTVFSWASPSKVTVTATAGSKTGTGYQNFVNASTDARVLSGTSNGNVVTAKVVDRYGNAVAGVKVSAKTSNGYFGSGATSTSGDTDENGEIGFAVTGGNATVTLSVDASVYTQTADLVGEVGAVAVTAAVAGTTTGVGASLAPAGVAKVTVETSAATSTSDAIDAANEATDAANAATDAANAAAEAADAATAAAQDAQAAVAALATQVASLIAGIKAQITTLTNLVIKIQKKVRA